VSSAAHYPEIDFADWERVVRINMTAPLFVVQSLDPLLARPGASIVMITSIEATHVISTSERSTPAYAAAKAGLKLITESLASDLAAEGVRVNAVAPGFVRTPLTDGMRDRGAGAWVEKVVPMSRWAEVDDIAQAAMYLLDDASSFVSGTSLVVDGGLTLGVTPAMTEDGKKR
jgi:NAD(P)-dependent dehydrogenase (short-subunit alcohol dehydrogenase family)